MWEACLVAFGASAVTAALMTAYKWGYFSGKLAERERRELLEAQIWDRVRRAADSPDWPEDIPG